MCVAAAAADVTTKGKVQLVAFQHALPTTVLLFDIRTSSELVTAPALGRLTPAICHIITYIHSNFAEKFNYMLLDHLVEPPRTTFYDMKFYNGSTRISIGISVKPPYNVRNIN